MSFKKIIHIGFPKTGTTSLQNHLFPYLCKEKNFLYNPPEYQRIKRQRLVYDSDDLMALRAVLRKNNVLISQEGLMDGNPRNWRAASERTLDLFGEDATIIITIRDPLEFMCSLYVQKIQEGNIIKPQDFFISSEKYDEITKFLPERSSLRYDYQKLDYQNLLSLYEEKFENVFIIPVSRIYTLFPFETLFSLSKAEVDKFIKILSNAPHENRSYSTLAIQLTFIREHILRGIGVKSLGSEDYPMSNTFLNKRHAQCANVCRTFSNMKKIINFVWRGIKKLMKPWRWWMQNVVDKIIPYQKFELSKNLLANIESDLLKKNRKFIRDYENKIDKFQNNTTNCE